MTDHGARAHSPYGASAAHRWFICPGSVARCKTAPPRTSAYAEEGTQAHELLELLLRSNYGLAPPGEKAPWDAVGEAPADMREAVAVHVERVEFILDAYPDAILLLEHKFDIPTDSAPEPVFGTNDVCIYVPSLKTLFVDDYKHGAGVAVEVEERGKPNLQLMTYGVGALFSFPEWQIERVELTIVQPRCFHPHGPVRSLSVSPADLIDFAGEFDLRVQATLDPNAPLSPDDKACRWCDARPGCPALQANALRVVGQSDIRHVNETTLPVPTQIPLDQLGYIMNAKKLVLGWFNDVEKYADELARTGVNIPGFKLVQAQRKRRWHGDPSLVAQQLIALSDFELTEDDVFPRKLANITDVSAKLKDVAKANAPRRGKTAAAKAVEESLAFLTIKDTSGNLVLVSESDKRPAVNASSHFGVVELPEISTVE